LTISLDRKWFKFEREAAKELRSNLAWKRALEIIFKFTNCPIILFHILSFLFMRMVIIVLKMLSSEIPNVTFYLCKRMNRASNRNSVNKIVYEESIRSKSFKKYFSWSNWSIKFITNTLKPLIDLSWGKKNCYENNSRLPAVYSISEIDFLPFL
jgi:hypothetical protein